MIPNFSAELCLPYGVIAAQHLPSLYEAITANGINTTHEDFREHLFERVKQAILFALDGLAEPIANHIHADFNANSAVLIEELEDLILPEDDAIREWLDNTFVFENAYEPDEECYSWTDPEDGCQYLIGWLGGAPLIWTTHSKWTLRCRQCSPCVPGAGDLDTPDPDGSEALCPNPEWFEADDAATDQHQFTYIHMELP